ncbi:hypothetical protein Len3610_01910 [Lentibacillus sp. CBA3610]|nr:hypothetical protein Len3610_01910 [Lentibacillus sp. CBA3610]
MAKLLQNTAWHFIGQTLLYQGVWHFFMLKKCGLIKNVIKITFTCDTVHFGESLSQIGYK